MGHIHTAPGQHDHTISIYIVRTDTGVPKLMLHKHKKLGMYMQFGGHIELDENPWQAVTHELKEETGYELNQLSLLQPKNRLANLTRATVHPYPVVYNTHQVGGIDSHFHSDISYAFTTAEKPRGVIDDGESDDLILVSQKELLALPKDKIYENVREICLFVLSDVLENWRLFPAEKASK